MVHAWAHVGVRAHAIMQNLHEILKFSASVLHVHCRVWHSFITVYYLSNASADE